MKKLIINGVNIPEMPELSAERVEKKGDTITGLSGGTVVFSFKGVTDFSMFTLKNDDGMSAEFDTPSPTTVELQTLVFDLTTQLVSKEVI